ncbi:hypothetical protein [Sphingobium sp. B11D3A]|uniref:hypothetical protein n=1 Tax=Sphingobium sp. B11D3A TaxID=2940574 RepID=UPI0022242F21|nr:hypothetical protein [Sphingobium sp. B11D3A]MCW2391926.1 hypothetical protein [Sphingobium sp. B11D3A]
MERIDDIRDAVAKALEERGHGNRQFLDEIRAGARDEGPFMFGAIVCAKLLNTAR